MKRKVHILGRGRVYSHEQQDMQWARGYVLTKPYHPFLQGLIAVCPYN